MDAEGLEQDAVRFAQLAVQQDQVGMYGPAAFYYTVRARPKDYCARSDIRGRDSSLR